jgi:hypothetical protein
MAAHPGGPEDGFLRGSRYDLNHAVIPLGAAFFAALAGRRVPRGTH